MAAIIIQDDLLTLSSANNPWSLAYPQAMVLSVMRIPASCAKWIEINGGI
jgi:hypothetical protein